jgi:hypothetical protein
VCRIPGAVAPGHTQVEHTPWAAPSRARTFGIIIITTAPLLIEYAPIACWRVASRSVRAMPALLITLHDGRICRVRWYQEPEEARA